MIIKKSPNINILWSKILVEELIRQGIDYFCLAPGSRSSPLAVAVAEHPKAQTCIHYDERGLGFHALGYTAATKKTSVLITTSGTAVANLLPAVIEASKKKLPLIVLTADRPPELRHAGANQTIDQVDIFGKYVRFAFDMPCPTSDIPVEFVLTTIGQLVYRSNGNPPGPVHLNCMFREPLAPVKDKTISPGYLKKINSWLNTTHPYTQYASAKKSLNAEQAKNIAAQIKKIKNGIIVVGKLASREEQRAVLKFAKKLNWPVFPDITSGLRLGNTNNQVIPYFDQILLSPKSKSWNVDGVLHLGGRITSKRWYEFVETTRPQDYIMVLNHPLRNDPLHNVTLRVESSVLDFCQAVSSRVSLRTKPNFLTALQKTSSLIDKIFDTELISSNNLNEPAVARMITQLAPEGSGLFLSSSLPVREVDMYGTANKHPLVIGSNRGASGIDGTIASASGFARGLNKPTTLLIGDLAFLHDLNSLSLVQPDRPLVIVVLNNNGGNIFSFLSINQFPKILEKYFITPHGLSFDSAADMFNIDYVRPESLEGFKLAYQSAIKRAGPTLIEIIIDQNENHLFQSKLFRVVSRNV